MFTKIIDAFKSKMPTWVTAVITIIVAVGAYAAVLYGGGETSQKFEGKNGAEYQIDFAMGEGIEALIKNCNLKELNQSCDVDVKVKATLTKLPTKSDEKAEETAATTEEVEAETKERSEDKSSKEEPKKEN